jgi:hypothetical protein
MPGSNGFISAVEKDIKTGWYHYLIGILVGLRALWSKHRHPNLIFPNANGSLKTIQQATTHMDRGGAQKAMKIVVTECGIKKSLYTLPSPQFRHSST